MNSYSYASQVKDLAGNSRVDMDLSDFLTYCIRELENYLISFLDVRDETGFSFKGSVCQG